MTGKCGSNKGNGKRKGRIISPGINGPGDTMLCILDWKWLVPIAGVAVALPHKPLVYFWAQLQPGDTVAFLKDSIPPKHSRLFASLPEACFLIGAFSAQGQGSQEMPEF